MSRRATGHATTTTIALHLYRTGYFHWLVKAVSEEAHRSPCLLGSHSILYLNRRGPGRARWILSHPGFVLEATTNLMALSQQEAHTLTACLRAGRARRLASVRLAIYYRLSVTG